MPVCSKVYEDNWDFLPLRTLEAVEVERHSRECCGRFMSELSSGLVYVVARKSLIRICDNHKLPHDHPPPGRQQANSVIPKKICIFLVGL